MGITDELREWFSDRLFMGNGYAELVAIADRIDAEHERAMREEYQRGVNDGYDMGFASADDWLAYHEDAMAEHGWVRGPLDADGVPIRVGDRLTDGEYAFTVDELAVYGDGSWSIRNEDGNAWAACDVTHYHVPTVEDVLREFADEVQRCCDTEDTIAEYAARLRLAEEDK